MVSLIRSQYGMVQCIYSDLPKSEIKQPQVGPDGRNTLRLAVKLNRYAYAQNQSHT